MSEVAKRLRERRQNVWEEAKALADKAAEENRAFSGEEEQTWQRLNAELDALDSRIKAVLDGEQRAKDAEDSFAKLNGRPVDNRAGNGQQGSGVSEELRNWMRGEGPRFYEVKPSGRVDWRAIQQRALSVGTLTAGGDTVPTSFYDRLVQHLIQNTTILQSGAMILNTASGEVIQVPKTTAHSNGALVNEGAPIPESDPAFGQVPLGAHKYGSLIQVSRELLDDTGVDLEGYLSMQAGRALGNAFGAHALTGTGTGQPRGIITDALVGKTGATAGGLVTADDVIDTYHSVIAPYRKSPSAAWMIADTSIGNLRKLKDTTGQYIWQPGLQAGVPDTLMGKPVLDEPNVPVIGSAAKSLVFGDMSTYFVRLAGGIRFERSDDYAFNTDLVTFRALMRADGALVDLTGSVKVFQGAV